MNLKAAKGYIYDKLQKNLSATLTYHGFHHTIDVVKAALRIAKKEGITNKNDLILLETAALYHDLGFVSTYGGHEEESCRIAKKTLPHFNYSTNEIAQILSMIMATKIPQTPKNLLEQIIADADLDYLGRKDFEIISNSLFLELKEREIVDNVGSWNKIQISFLESHHFWTKTSIELRTKEKLKRIEELKRIVEQE